MTVATSSFPYDTLEPMRAPIMVVGDTPAARQRARHTSELSGLRTLSELSPAEAIEALAQGDATGQNVVKGHCGTTRLISR